MSKRLQVVVPDSDLRRFQAAARSAGMTLAEWVRQALRRAETASATGEPERRLDAIRAATRHEFPAPDIEEMLDEIERGRHQGQV